MNEQPNYSDNSYGNPNSAVRELENKFRNLRERVILLGQNMIEIREKNKEAILEIKKNMEIMKQNVERLVSFLETASSEFSKFAKKEDLEILAKQAKIFQHIPKN
jgi:Fic family protein